MKILSKIVDTNSLILEDFIYDYNITEPRKLSSYSILDNEESNRLETIAYNNSIDKTLYLLSEFIHNIGLKHDSRLYYGHNLTLYRFISTFQKLYSEYDESNNKNKLSIRGEL